MAYYWTPTDEFLDVYKMWRRYEVTQTEAARLLGVSQSTFSRQKSLFEADNDLAPRGDKLLSRLPAGFLRIAARYKAGEITCREAGMILGISHATFLGHFHRIDALGMVPCPEVRPTRNIRENVA